MVADMTDHTLSQPCRALIWQDNALHLLDQRALPHSRDWIICTNSEHVATAITDMVVRGAPAIGIAVAYAMAMDAHAQRDLTQAHARLAASRPTAVNLFWALDACQHCIENQAEHTQPLAERLLAVAKDIHTQDIRDNERMGQYGSEHILTQHAPVRVYTHCNTGSLATGGFGTALGVVRSLHGKGQLAHLYAGETRPWLQGARLTAWECMHDNIDTTLVCDSAAASLFAQKLVDWVIVGADRIAANGDVANKIGTYSLAVLAKHHGIKFMVAAPLSTFDLNIATGCDITIEERPAHEVTALHGQAIAPENCAAFNPSFDITPAELIDAIVTPQGVIASPNAQAVSEHTGLHA